ncbi:MAG: hypothetical protein E7552_03620 [Ruminococcaceae bacterium]|nr:hypothetical protein [Oscillospiraceae bacterium]
MKLTVRQTAVFAMLGALMLISKKVMEFLPNVHLVGVFIVAATVVYRVHALYPLYLYVLLDGLLAGFSTWWIPYLYIWTVLWGAVMLLPRRLPPRLAPFVWGAVCGLHGLLFGVLYAPAQALFFDLSFEGTLTWIAAGLPFDAIHGASNLAAGTLLIPPLVAVMRRAEKTAE